MNPAPQQRWLRIIPVALIMYTISYIDRTNISMALPSMSRDLHMNPVEAGSVAGAFFWGYVLLQIPAGYVANRWSAKRLISILLAGWGLAAVGCGLVQSWRELWIMRLLLGLAESGVWPAALVLISHWFPRTERARANALWIACLPLAVVFSSPLSGWILDHWNWRVMLVAEGALPLVWLIVWEGLIDDYPRNSKWISDGERKFLESKFAQESVDLEQSSSAGLLTTFLRPQVLLLTFITFLRNVADFGFLVWLPSALERTTKLSNTKTGSLVAIPFLVAIFAMLVNSWHSDKTAERRRHMAFTFAVGGISLIVSVLLSSQSPGLAFGFICFAAVGSYGHQGPFWAIPTETLPRNVAGPAIGFINALGNVGAFWGAIAVGFLNKRTGDFRSGFNLLGVALLVAAMLCFLLEPTRERANKEL